MAPTASTTCPWCLAGIQGSFAAHVRLQHHTAGIVSCPFPTCTRTFSTARVDAITDHWSRFHDFYLQNDPMARSTARTHLRRKTHDLLVQRVQVDTYELELCKARVLYAEAELTRVDPGYVPMYGVAAAPGAGIPLDELLAMSKLELVDELIDVRERWEYWEQLLVCLRDEAEGLNMLMEVE